jgi:hypothetical protein
MNKAYIITILVFASIVGQPGHLQGHPSSDSKVKAIDKALKNTGYSAKPTTIKQAKANHSGNWLNCAQYSFKIKDLDKDAEVWLVTGSHVISVITLENGKRICYSNGKKVREDNYYKIRRVE